MNSSTLFLAVFWLSRVATQVLHVDTQTKRSNLVGNAAFGGGS